ncbi:YeiH family protein [Tessaracoccus sp. ZS01]|uniref:YeiH family protein n=1 Tax=Tessaracoccus sp. ZS01 TaxID=1906324 RepID=UPI0018E9C355|nr:putative sulfate exporter family transporter [Tessaracoccus sp. ZS01]
MTTATAARTSASVLPGLAAAFAAALLAVAIAQVVPTLSPLLVAIILGVLWRNLAGQPASWAPGVAVAGKRVLRIGIVLLGFQVSLVEVFGLGAGTLLLVVAAVGVTFFTTRLLGRRLGLSMAQSTLIAAGFSICGAAAVVGVEPVTDADENDTATAVALVVVFGTLLIPLLPLAVAALNLGAQAGGMWVGASTHEVAQVVAAAGLIGQEALPVAVTVKLARVLCLAPMVALLAMGRRRRATADATSALPPIVPLFIAGFVIAMLVRTVGILPGPPLGAIAVGQKLLLAAAMFALGLGVHVKSMLKVGGKPFILATIATGIITSIGLAGALVLA